MTSPFEIKVPIRIGEIRVYLQTRISQCIVTNVDLENKDGEDL